MSKSIYPKTHRGTALWWIGLWATIWWAVSLLWIVLLFWLAKDIYVGDWSAALGEAYTNSYMPAVLVFILAGWLVGGLLWLRELKKQRIGYAAAFKDLFLTIRR